MHKYIYMLCWCCTYVFLFLLWIFLSLLFKELRWRKHPHFLIYYYFIFCCCCFVFSFSSRVHPWYSRLTRSICLYSLFYPLEIVSGYYTWWHVALMNFVTSNFFCDFKNKIIKYWHRCKVRSTSRLRSI